jgi:hypothetical protein
LAGADLDWPENPKQHALSRFVASLTLA